MRQLGIILLGSLLLLPAGCGGKTEEKTDKSEPPAGADAKPPKNETASRLPGDPLPKPAGNNRPTWQTTHPNRRATRRARRRTRPANRNRPAAILARCPKNSRRIATSPECRLRY